MLQTISTLALFAAPLTGLAVLVYILARSILDFRYAKHKKGRGYIVLKAFASLAAWFLASWGMFFMLFITFYTSAHVEDRGAAERSVAASLIVLSLIYALIGCGLTFWVRHRADNEPVSIFPEGAA